MCFGPLDIQAIANVMRRSWLVTSAIAGIITCALAIAGPQPTATEQEQLGTLRTELQQELAKQAYAAAVKTATKLVELDTKMYGKDAREVYIARQQLADVYSFWGDYAEASKIYLELVSQAEHQHGADSDEVVSALQVATSPLLAQGKFDELDPIEQRIVAITKKVHGDKSALYANALRTYATILMSHDEYQAALGLDEQALKILETLPDPLAIATAKQALATLYWQANQKPKAIALYAQLIKDAEASPTATPTKVGTTIFGVAIMYHYGGRDDLAKPLLQRALDLFDKELARLEKAKPDDSEIADMLGMSGHIVHLLGDLPNAEQRLRKAAELDEKRRGFTGSYWNTVAEIERQQGHFKEALAVLEMLSSKMAKTSPRAAGAYNLSIAAVLKDTGDYKRAEKLVSEHLVEVAKQYGRRHPYYGIFEVNLAMIYLAARDIANGETALGEALEIGEHELSLVLKTGTDNDHAVFFAKRAYLLDNAVSFNYVLAPKSAGATKLALTTLLRRKGRLLDASAASLATLRAKLSPADKKLLDELATARAKLAKLTVAGPGAGDANEYAKQLAALEDNVQQLELQLGNRSASFRATAMPIELAAIQKMIPNDGKLVEVVNFQPTDPKVYYGGGTPLPPRRYAAYVLGPTGDPVFVDLGAASDIDDAVAKLRKAVADPDNDRAAELGHALYKLTVAKLS